jgi:hypothetical protein
VEKVFKDPDELYGIYSRLRRACEQSAYEGLHETKKKRAAGRRGQAHGAARALAMAQARAPHCPPPVDLGAAAPYAGLGLDAVRSRA